MASIVAQLQTAWFLDPLNTSGTAADTNDGLTAATAIRSTQEFLRRVGTPLLLQEGQEVIITFLSSVRPGERFGLEVIGNAVGEVGPTGRVIVRGTYTPQTSGVVDALVAADQINNVLAEVDLSFNGDPGDRATMMLYVDGKGFVPYTVDQGDGAPDLTYLDRAYAPEGSWTQIADGDEVFRFFPISLGDVAFLKADASSGAQLDVQGVAIDGLAEAAGVSFRGCLIEGTRRVSNCSFYGCSLGAGGNPCMMQFTNYVEGCFVGSLISQGGVRFVAGLCGFLTVDPQAWITLAGLAGDANSTIEVYAGAKVLVTEANGFFGSNSLIRLSADASVVRDGIGTITMLSETPIEWPNAAPLTEVYDADTLLPTETPANPADNTWAAYNGGVSGGNWIHWRTGARLTKE